MPFSFLNKAVSIYLKYRYNTIVEESEKYQEMQDQFLFSMINGCEATVYGKKFNLKNITSISQFKNEVPLVKYEDLAPYISRMMEGETGVLWLEKIRYFSKSSGTTNDRSKYIPITDEYLRTNLINSSWDTTSFMYNINPDSQLFYKKTLIMGGCLHHHHVEDVMVGDVSAIMINTIPLIGRFFYTPDNETALLKNWDEKIDKIAQKCIEEDITLFGGVPTWNIVLFNKLLEMTGKKNMLEVWPSLSFYVHGGVNFDPYKSTFQKYIPKEDFNYIEVYNASEGYFAVQDTAINNGMRLLVNNGIYYEFILPENLVDYNTRGSKTLNLSEVEVNINYAIVITTMNGIFRYIIGDTVMFTSIKPHRIKVTGRIEQYLNAFGEEVMVSNTDKALSMTADQMGLHIKEYTVAPYFLNEKVKGHHDWLIEFENEPSNINLFENMLDQNLRNINSDYDAKRYGDLAMTQLKVHVAKKNQFIKWLHKKDKIGGQHKVPRLCNNRTFLDEILQLTEENDGR